MEQPHTAPEQGRAENQEIELKLSVCPAGLERLAAASLWSGKEGARKRGALLSQTPLVSHQIDSTYYDTPAFALAKKRLALRLRSLDGLRHILGVKATDDEEGRALAPKRGEWEVEIPTPRLLLERLPDQKIARKITKLAGDGLHPLFTTRIRRLSRLLSLPEGAAVEICYDSGVLETASGLVVPVSEVELELRQGNTAALYETALSLNALEPLRLETQNKAARGYALVAEKPPEPVRFVRPPLDCETQVEEALSSLLTHILGHLAANQAATLDAHDPEGLHQMRVALRRLRAVFSVFQPILPLGAATAFSRRVKDMAAALGTAREWDVVELDFLQPVRGALQDKPELQAITAAVAARRQAARKTARQMLTGGSFTALLLDIALWRERQGWREGADLRQQEYLSRPVTEVAGMVLRRRHRRMLQLGRSFSASAPEDRHRLRIAIKKLRYATDFLAPLYDADEKGIARRYVRELARLQEALGQDHDLTSAEILLASLSPEDAPDVERGAGIVLGWHHRRQGRRLRQLTERWEKFSATLPFWRRGFREREETEE